MRSGARGRVALQAATVTAALAAGLVSGLSAGSAAATKPAADGTHKVTICHRTNADTNPYVVITVDFSAVDGSLGNGGNDHTHHDGPVWSPGLKASQVKWGDIIPPYTFAGGSFPGQNWSSPGQAVYEAGCGAPSEAPPEPCPWDPGIPADDPACVQPG